MYEEIYKNALKTNLGSQFIRKIILILLDLSIAIFSITLCLSNNQFQLDNNFLIFLFLIVLIYLSIYLITGQYKGLTYYYGENEIKKIIYRNFFGVCLLFFYNILYLKTINIKVLFLFFLTCSSITIFYRFIFYKLLIKLKLSKFSSSKNSIIYGAGSAGAQLANSLKISSKDRVISFIDDDPNLWNRSLSGIPINSPRHINKIQDKVDKVLLAIPSLSSNRRKEIFEEIKSKGLAIYQVPTLAELSSGKATISKLKKIDIQDLLGRESVYYDVVSQKRYISNSNFCVTGAGGSIGREICMQLLKFKPKSLVVIENNEYNLYQLDQDIKKEYPDIKFVPYLGDASDINFVQNIFKRNHINCIFHAAAYKHVPIVEKNPLAAIKNNVFSTTNLCEEAFKAKIDKFILISTDKAVRPTNVMGATKRLSEIIVQYYSKKSKLLFKGQHKTKICYSMVRFGNVLNSSGSVIPLFNKQISNGGPITITHRDIERYFMTIPEAAQLVLQSSALAQGGEVFLLDMGKPKKIYDLALNMIKLNGLSLRNRDNPNGDIEILFTGLRPGEKLYEELLVEPHSEKTKHPLIFKAIEKKNFSNNLIEKIKMMNKYLIEQNETEVLKILSYLVAEWKPAKILKDQYLK